MTVDAPQGALTPDLVDHLKAHQVDLLAILRTDAGHTSVDPTDATAVWQAALDRLARDPSFSADMMEALHSADVHWANEPENDDAIDPPDPCPKCGSLELWEALAGRWRCLRCDPPTTSQRLAEKAARLRKRTRQ